MNNEPITVYCLLRSTGGENAKIAFMNPIDELQPFTWPASQLNEAIVALAEKSGFLSETKELNMSSPKISENDTQALNKWMRSAATWLGLEAEFVTTGYTEVEQLLRSGGPALFRLPAGSASDERRFLLLLSGGLRQLSIVSPDLSVRRIKPLLVRDALCYALDEPLLAEVEEFLGQMKMPQKRLPRARLAVLRARLSDTEIGDSWLLRLSPSGSLWKQARYANLPFYILLSIFGQAIEAIALYVVMGLVGFSALQGHIEWAWLLLGLLILFTAMPFLLIKIWAEKIFALKFGQILKKRLFYGVLRLKPNEVQLQGEGQFLAWVFESERLEEANAIALPLVLGATVSLLITAVVLTMGAGGIWHGLLLLSWLLLTGVISWRAIQTYFIQSQYYNGLTSYFVEGIEGHQTRLVQERDWYDRDDQALTHYLTLSKKDDLNRTWLLYFIPYGWLAIGTLGVVHTFIFEPSAFVPLGISFFGILMSFQFFDQLVWNMTNIARAVAAWKMIRPVFQAAVRPPPKGRKIMAMKRAQEGQQILEARSLSFRYQTGKAILSECNLQIYVGDRLLLEGPSGGGKSTLASLLIGLLNPKSGLLLLRGLDWPTIGEEAWRQRIVGAPQFHENHILNASFAFNLLMGSNWPPTEEKLSEAEAICRELGLGELLDRMPQGIHQPIGEEGWVLSHGERSRLYIVRTLLQNADLIILDESFGALDPENMEIALRTVLRRAPTLLVIAHP